VCHTLSPDAASLGYLTQTAPASPVSVQSVIPVSGSSSVTSDTVDGATVQAGAVSLPDNDGSIQADIPDANTTADGASISSAASVPRALSGGASAAGAGGRAPLDQSGLEDLIPPLQLTAAHKAPGEA